MLSPPSAVSLCSTTHVQSFPKGTTGIFNHVVGNRVSPFRSARNHGQVEQTPYLPGPDLVPTGDIAEVVRYLQVLLEFVPGCREQEFDRPRNLHGRIGRAKPVDL